MERKKKKNILLFGKYKNQSYEEVYEKDKIYLLWVYEKCNIILWIKKH